MCHRCTKFDFSKIEIKEDKKKNSPGPLNEFILALFS
jgi:hypothetical protein